MTGLDCELFDCDTHCYETRDSFTRYLPKEWQQHAIAPVRLQDGTERILAADRIAVFNSEQGLGFDLAYRPGSLKEMLRQMGSGNPDETYQPEPMRPEYLDREARLKLMDVQGVERAVVFPSAMALSVENYVNNVPAAYANLHSFNRWFDEEWGFGRDGKIFAPALLSLPTATSRSPSSTSCSTRGPGSSCCPPGPRTGAHPATRTSTRSGPG